MVFSCMDKWTPIQMIRLFLILIFCLATPVESKEKKKKIFDSYGKYKGSITDGRIYDPYGKLKGKVTKDGKLYDPYGKYMGRIFK